MWRRERTWETQSQTQESERKKEALSILIKSIPTGSMSKGKGLTVIDESNLIKDQRRGEALIHRMYQTLHGGNVEETAADH